MSNGFHGLSFPSGRPMLAAKMDAAAPSTRWFERWLLADPGIPGPRTLPEGILIPFYLLVALTSIQLFISPPASYGPPPPAWLDFCAIGVGALGVLYPSRYVSIAALCGFWLATVLSQWGHGAQGVANWLTLFLFAVLSSLYVALAVWVERQRAKAVRTRAQAERFEDYSTRMAAFLAGPLATLRADPPLTVPGTADTTTLSGLRPVEVSRHFDSALEASITGGFEQWMNFRGLGAGIGIGRFSLGVSGGRGRGAGTIDLAAQGTIREDIVNDSYTAVLERDSSDSPDVTRLVVPAAIAIRDYVRQLIWDWQRSLTINSKAELVVRIHLDGLADHLTCESSYVGDRLSSLAKLGRDARASVSVVGAQLGDHALLAGAVQFSPDGEWYQLFPIASVNAILDLINGRLPTPPAPPPVAPQQPPHGEPTISNGKFAEAVVEPAANGTAHARLSIVSIGRLNVIHDATDLTTVLTQKPVASFLWLYLLARALRNPKDTLGRAALADEAFPNLDPKQQRTRLRQRLSDMQATLPRAIADCLVLDGERIHFDLEACHLDAADLRGWAATVASLRTPLDEAQLREAAVFVDGLGGGMFLPEWETLEAKVTGGKGGAATVVDDVRTDVDRWRAALLMAIADSYTVRNRPALAVPYLEQVVSQHPDNEPATRKLMAAYLESGETAKAAALDPAAAKMRR